MAEVRIKILTSAELNAAVAARDHIQQVYDATDKSDMKAKEYAQTIQALNQAINSNSIAEGKRLQELVNQIKLTDSLGVSNKALKSEYASLAQSLAQGQGAGGASIFGKMREDLLGIAREVPGLSGMLAKTFTAASGPLGLFTAGLGAAYESIKNYAGTEVLWAKLDASLAAHGHLLDGTREKYIALTHSLAARTLGTVEQDWARVINQLTNFGRNVQQVSKDTETIRNLTGVFGNLNLAVMAYTQSMNGQFFLLRRHGIVIDQHLSQMEKMNQLQRQAAEIGGSQLLAAQSTLVGQWEQMTSALHRLSTAIGADLMPLLAPFKLIMHALGEDAKALATFLERVSPPIAGLRNQVGKVTESMGDARQEMEEYQRAWRATEAQIKAATDALSKHDDQLNKSLDAQKKFAQWQEEKDILDIQRNPNLTPVEREARIAMRKGKTAKDIAEAQTRLDEAQILEQVNVVTTTQGRMGQSERDIKGIIANPNLAPEQRENALRAYAEQRVVFQKMLQDAQNKLGDLTDKLRMDIESGKHDIADSVMKVNESRLKNTIDIAKVQLEDRQSPQLTPQALGTLEGTRMLNRSLFLGDPEIVRVMQAAGGKQLDDFISKYKDSAYQNAVAKATYYRTQISLMETQTDLANALATNDTKAELEARQKLSETQGNLTYQFNQQYQKWIEGGRRGYAPINPLATYNQLGQYRGVTQPPTGAVSPDVQAALAAYNQTQRYAPQAGMTPFTSTARFAPTQEFDATGLVPAPDGFDPRTMGIAMDGQGRARVVTRNPDGSLDFGTIISMTGGGKQTQTPFEPLTPGATISGPAISAFPLPEGTAGAGGGAATGAGGVTEGAPIPASGMEAWSNAHPIYSNIAGTAGAFLLASLLTRGVGASGRLLKAGVGRWMGRPITTTGVPTGGVSAGIPIPGGVQSFTPSPTPQISVTRGGAIEGEQGAITGSRNAGVAQMQQEVVAFSKNYDKAVEGARQRMVDANKSLEDLKIKLQPQLWGTIGKSKEIEALEFLKNHPEWQDAINQGARTSGLRGRNIAAWTDTDIQEHIMKLSARNVENGAYALRAGSAQPLQGLTARNLRELGLINARGETGLPVQFQLENATQKAWERVAKTGQPVLPTEAQSLQLQQAEALAKSRAAAYQKLQTERTATIEAVEKEARLKVLQTEPLTSPRKPLPGETGFQLETGSVTPAQIAKTQPWWQKGDLGEKAPTTLFSKFGKGVSRFARLGSKLGMGASAVLGGYEAYKDYQAGETEVAATDIVQGAIGMTGVGAAVEAGFIPWRIGIEKLHGYNLEGEYGGQETGNRRAELMYQTSQKLYHDPAYANLTDEERRIWMRRQEGVALTSEEQQKLAAAQQEVAAAKEGRSPRAVAKQTETTHAGLEAQARGVSPEGGYDFGTASGRTSTLIDRMKTIHGEIKGGDMDIRGVKGEDRKLLEDVYRMQQGEKVEGLQSQLKQAEQAMRSTMADKTLPAEAKSSAYKQYESTRGVLLKQISGLQKDMRRAPSGADLLDWMNTQFSGGDEPAQMRTQLQQYFQKTMPHPLPSVATGGVTDTTKPGMITGLTPKEIEAFAKANNMNVDNIRKILAMYGDSTTKIDALVRVAEGLNKQVNHVKSQLVQ